MFYLGIDQHARQLTISLRDEQGDVIQARQVSTQPEKIQEFIERLKRQFLGDGESLLAVGESAMSAASKPTSAAQSALNDSLDDDFGLPKKSQSSGSDGGAKHVTAAAQALAQAEQQVLTVAKQRVEAYAQMGEGAIRAARDVAFLMAANQDDLKVSTSVRCRRTGRAGRLAGVAGVFSRWLRCEQRQPQRPRRLPRAPPLDDARASLANVRDRIATNQTESTAPPRPCGNTNGHLKPRSWPTKQSRPKQSNESGSPNPMPTKRHSSSATFCD